MTILDTHQDIAHEGDLIIIIMGVVITFVLVMIGLGIISSYATDKIGWFLIVGGLITFIALGLYSRTIEKVDQYEALIEDFDEFDQDEYKIITNIKNDIYLIEKITPEEDTK